MVQSLSLGTGVLAGGVSMDLELASGTGASVRADASAHHRVCSCPPTTERASSHTSVLSRSCIRVCSTQHCNLLEGWSLLWRRLSSPIRWDALLSRREIIDLPGASSRSRWQPARRVCGQHPQLPPLPSARAVPMEWRCHQEAAPGQRTLASAPGGVCPAALARLEPQNTPACLHAARAPPAPGDEPVATCRHFATHRVRDPVSRTTCAVSFRLSSAAGSQCSRFHSWASHDPIVRHPSSLCRLARRSFGLISS